MAETLTDAVPQILIKIQESISALRSEVGQFRTSVEGRLDRLEQLNRKYRRDAAAMMVIMRATAGDFDERVSEVEGRVTALEASKI
jgi:uncharacterized protein YqgV (UPF0045/DUF77 family)